MDESVFAPGSKKWVTPFFIIWIGQAFSLVGSQVVQFAIIWWITKTTGSATLLAAAALVGLLPQVILGPFVGTLVDRWNRRLIMIVADGVSALAIIVMTYLFWSNRIEVWQVFIIMFVRSLANGFHWPAMQASVTLMVPKVFFTRVQGMNQAMAGFMTILGAPMGALLVATLDTYQILMIDIFTATIAIVPLLFIRIPQPKRELAVASEARPTVWQDFKEGWRYVFGWSGLVMILVMSTLINLLVTPASSLMPIMVTKELGRGALQLAWMQSAWGIGTIFGGIILAAWGGFRRRIVTSLMGLILLGIGMVALGLTPRAIFFMTIGTAFFLGLVNPIVNGPLMAVVQGTVEPGMQGRVFTLINSFAGAMTPIGLIIAGPVADIFGVRIWYIVGGIVTALLGVVSFTIPAIMHIEDGHAPRLANQEVAALEPEN